MLIKHYFSILISVLLFIGDYIEGLPQFENFLRLQAFKGMDRQVLTTKHFLQNAPTCETDETFCEEVDNYPSSYFKQVLKTFHQQSEFFNEINQNVQVEDELTDRTSNEELFVCPSVKTLVYPKTAKNRDNQWKFIYNLDNYKQAAPIEVCIRRGQSCNALGDKQFGLTTFCKQKYLERKMLSSNPQGEPEADHFLFPSGCACAYRRTTKFRIKFNPKPADE